MPDSTARNRVPFKSQPRLQLVDDAGEAVAVAGIAVTVGLSSGGGSLSGNLSVTTNEQGIATFTDLAIAGKTGRKTLAFSAGGLKGTALSATLFAGAPSSVALSEGNNQTAVAGSAVLTAPAVKVTDVDGNGVDSAQVTFSVTAGGGAVEGAAVRSDSSGVARVSRWTLGKVAGANGLAASVATLIGKDVPFSATGVAGPAAQVVIAAGNDQSAPAGSTVAIRPAVRVVDANANPVSGVDVIFSVSNGSGTISGIVSTSGVDGLASLASWQLGVVPGANGLTATSGRLAGSPLSFTATGSAPDSIPNGENKVGNITLPGQLQAYSVMATKGDAFIVSVGKSSPSATLLPLVRVLSPSGVLIADGIGSSAAQTFAIASSTGTYTVVVGSGDNSASGTGSYTVTAVRSPAAVGVTAGDEGGNLVAGTPQTATLYVGDVDAWSFTASKNETITLEMEKVSGSVVPWIRMLSPAGSVVGEDYQAGTARIVATAFAAGTYTLVAGTNDDGHAGSGSYRLKLNIKGPLATVQSIPSIIWTAGVPLGPVSPVSATGGLNPYTFGLNGTLPAGLDFASTTGAISGTPSAQTATKALSVTVTDAEFSSSTKGFAITINAPLVAQSVGALTGILNSPFATVTPVAATGGTPPYSFVLSGGALPAGLTFNSVTGQLSGTPTAKMTTTAFTITVSDTVRAVSARTFTLAVSDAPVELTTTQLVPSVGAKVNTALAAVVPVGASGGTPPYSFELSAGTLPSGLQFNSATGAVSGTPTTLMSPASLTVTAKDAQQRTSAKAFTLSVSSAGAALGATVVVPTVAATTSAPIPPFAPVVATGGSGEYSFAISGASLPTGVILDNRTGQVTGTPAAPVAPTSYTVNVTDALKATATKSFELRVNAPLSVTPAVETMTGTVNAVLPSFATIYATAGTTPYTYRLSGGTLPPGVTFDGATGVMSGTPTATLGATSFTTTVTDAAGASAAKSFSFSVKAAGSALTATKVYANRIDRLGTAADFIPVTSSGGTAPRVFALTGGTLPDGMSFNTSTGALSGTPRTTMTAQAFTVSVTDGAGAKVSEAFSWSVRLEGDAPGLNGATTPVRIEPYDAQAGTRIDPTRTTWVVVHGRDNTMTTAEMQLLAQAIRAKRATDQILMIDWSAAANALAGAFSGGEKWLQPVGQYSADLLKSAGFADGTRINLVGHSWGTYVADHLAARLGGVDVIVALDPAADDPTYGDIHSPAASNFMEHSRFAIAFHTSWAWGSESAAARADESFTVGFNVDPRLGVQTLQLDQTSAHGGSRELFAALVQGEGGVSKLFSLKRFSDHTKGIWQVDRYEPREGDASGVPHSALYEGVIFTGAPTSRTPFDLRFFGPDGVEVTVFESAVSTLFLSAPTGTPTASPGESVSITLTVTDASGQAVPLATVTWVDNVSKSDGQKTTDSQGKVTFTTTVPAGKASGTYDVTFTAGKANYTNSAVITRSVKVVPKPTLSATVTPSLVQSRYEGQTVSYDITVRDENGATVAGAAVGGEDKLQGRSFTTDPTGTSGTTTYTTTVPAGRTPASYDITFVASKNAVTSDVVPRTVTVLATPRGSIGSTLLKLDGTAAPAAGTRHLLYTSPNRSLSNVNPAVFDDVPADTWLLEGYFTGTFFGEEFWTSRQVTVDANTSKQTTLKRDYPYAASVVIRNDASGATVGAGESVASGTVLRAEITVQNNVPGTSMSVKVRLLVDANQASPYDVDKSSSSATVGGSSSKVFTVTFTPTSSGQNYYALEVTTTLPSGNSKRTDSWTWTQGPYMSTVVTDLIQNGGFESGSANWTTTGNAYISTTQANPHTGNGYSFLGTNSAGEAVNNASGSVYQTVAIPSALNGAVLRFWLSITTFETTSSSTFDKFKVTIRNSSGALLATVVNKSNLDSGLYREISVDLSQYRGQTVRIQFEMTSDFSNTTVFRVDDVSLRSQ